MKCGVIFFLVYNLALGAADTELDNLYNEVQSVLAGVQSYQVPVDNSALFTITNDTIVEYEDYDFVIIGAGAAGAVLANRLSEIYSWRILLLEAGGNSNKFSEIPQLIANLRRTDMNWGYFSTPQKTCCQGMINKQCIYPRGKVLGGTTTINGGVYSRGPRSDYNLWAAMGNTGWSYDEVLPYFKKSEFNALTEYDEGYHGSSGYLYVNRTTPPSVVAEAFCKANLEKGLKDIDYNGRQQIGVSRMEFNIKYNIKQNSERAFLDTIKERNNLDIVLNAAVNKIVIVKDEAKLVTFVKNGTLHKVKARKEVILSAGAINSPQLLMVSGVGPKKDLEKLGIPIKVDLPQVGKNLQDHPMFVNLYFRTNQTAPSTTLKEKLALYLQKQTPLTNGAGLEQLAFLNSKTILFGDPDIELMTFAPPSSVPPNPKFAFNFDESNSAVYKNYNPLTDVSILVSLLKVKSRGQVTLKSSNIVDFPLIDLNFFSDAKGEDIATMYKGIQYALSLLNTKAFKSVNATLVSTQPNCEQYKDKGDKEYWYCALRQMTSTEYHTAGTTRMGLRPTDSVVNKDCIVHNIRNLRVVDAGVMPEIPQAHVNAAVYMIAEKISDVIKCKHGKLNSPKCNYKPKILF
ncbi:glucose dehydrogenase [FAD, quinone]-like [Diabrotica virgifera virgifera]|uniref:Glucose-methanol-choline oxidoreductase N-terminal domain-containing protein n=1 Tax=Diabrotica virgifera virgifera TaxID=50390 RepID=A0ABM5KVS1_DIAVI|nr:glucose dehydrogenase [FAD, quinone]-like [Diabrotica virgifera virgifera]